MLVLTGALPLVLLLAAVLAFPLSLGLLALYRRAVSRSMRSPGSSEVAFAPALGTPSPPHEVPLGRDPVPAPTPSHALTGQAAVSPGDLHHRLQGRPWRVAAVYAAAGGCYALVVGAAYAGAAGGDPGPLRLLNTFWIHAWPIVIMLWLVAATTWRARLATAVGYFLILAGLAGLTALLRPGGGGILLAVSWALTQLPVTLVLLAFLNRRIRAVGPLVLTLVFVALGGSNIVLFAVANNARVFDAAFEGKPGWGLVSWVFVPALIVLGIAAFTAVGWIVLRGVGALYERKWISDQSITIDAMWLFFAVASFVYLVFDGIGWAFIGIGAFAIYKLVGWLGFRLAGRGQSAQSRRAPSLLLLRVFSLGRRSERLFDAVTLHWRHIGGVRLIAGPDLATTTVEPHEFLDFLSRKLQRQFIDGADALAKRLSEVDLEPDHDGRFRVDDFFCYEDTWRTVLSRLVNDTDVVLMDLRGLSPQNAGVAFEIEELLNVVPLERVVFVADGTTDEPFLRKTLEGSWARLRSTSPNREASPEKVRVFEFTGSPSGGLRKLLEALAAASSAGVPRGLTSRSGM